MNFKYLFGAVMLVGLCAVAAEKPPGKRGGINTRESIIAQLAPNEYRELNEQRSTDVQNSAAAALKLLHATRENLRAVRAQKDYDYDFVNAHAGAWRICLETRNSLKDPTAKQPILDEWNGSLRVENDEIPIQFAATIFPKAWDKDLFSDEFWRLAERTTNKKTLSAICWLLYTHWPSAELQLLQKREESAKPPLVGYIRAAIDQIKFQNQPSGSTVPPPASEPPTLQLD